MDLLSALPEEIFTEVASYLKGGDILEALLVCKTWNEIFCQSKECMKKVRIAYCYYNYNGDVSPLLSSTRQYQNATFGFNLKLPLKPGIEPMIKKILQKFSKSIVELVATQVFQLDFTLPNLKALILVNSFKDNSTISDHFCVNGLDVMFPNVTKLEITFGEFNGHVRTLQDAISKMRNLKSLKVNHISLLDNFPVSECKFKLEELIMRCYIEAQMCSLTNLDFLKHHRSTLKFLGIKRLIFEDIPFILTEFPSLDTLQLSYLYRPRDKKLEFPENSSIKNLRLKYHLCGRPKKKLAGIFTKLKRLQKVTIYMIHSPFIPKLFACNSLKQVRYAFISKSATNEQKYCMKHNEKIKFIRFSRN